MQYLYALLINLVATVLCWALDTHLSLAAIAMVYLLILLLSAAYLPRRAALAASVLGSMALNFFFIPPLHTFAVESAEYWLILGCFLLLALAVNTLFDQLKRARALAELKLAQNVELHNLSVDLGVCTDEGALINTALEALERIVRLPCALYLQDGETLICHSNSQRGNESSNDSNVESHIENSSDTTRFNPQAAAWALESRRMLGRGCPDWGELALWCAPFAGLQPRGAVQVLLPKGAKPEHIAHWSALVQQIGWTLERGEAVRRAGLAQQQADAVITRNALLAALSHDMRTPLAAMLGSVTTLRVQGEMMRTGAREQLLTQLEDEVLDMTQMVDNLLQLTRMEQSQNDLDNSAAIALQWESAADILQQTVAKLRRRWRDKKIISRVPHDFPLIRVHAVLLSQVIVNLVDNALRHGAPVEEGAPADVVLQFSRRQGGVQLSVRDWGVGLAATQESKHTKHTKHTDHITHDQKSRHGQGLGLLICERIVLAHGATMERGPAQPCGTEVKIYFPEQHTMPGVNIESAAESAAENPTL